MSIKFIGILGSNYRHTNDIAINDISLAEGTCTGLLYQEEMCVPIDEKTHKETECPKGYLNFADSHLLFDPEKQECSKIYNQTKNHLLEECKKSNDSETCLIDLSTDTSDYPECFQLYDYHIIHTCEDEELTTVSSVITSKRYSSSDQKSAPVSSDITSGRGKTVKTTTSFTSSESSSAVSDETITAARAIVNSNDSETGLTVGLVIGALLLVFAVLVIIILIRRHTWSNLREKIKNNIGENDYIGSQDIALPLAANHSRHMQNTGKYNGSSDTSRRANTHNNHDYTNVGAVKGLVNDDVQVPTYARRQDKTFADNHMPNDDEYAVVHPTAETSFNKTTYNKTGTADSYMVLDPTQTGFNRQILSNTPVGFEFAKPVHDTENKIIEDDQYAISDGVYDHSGNNRHKESENNIYNHTVDTIYDSGNFQRPMKRICESDKTLTAASVAAPMRKLCPLYLELSRPQDAKHLCNILSKTGRCNGVASTEQNNGSVSTK
ncbi:Hypothetical predicted protein [Mytilus galloprovincialis]|uniref:Uncharacterized protein n=1 Tax=Mytilus galloprovincialis TaxID=29158 RepID=A0A8B6F605_MYTGA|nr:Hypothetical predicted protein [Mytilus galloprovincialis]